MKFRVRSPLTTSPYIGFNWLGKGRTHFAFPLETTKTIIYVYLLSIATEIFGNCRSRNTNDARKNWNIHNTRLMSITGLRINNMNTQLVFLACNIQSIILKRINLPSFVQYIPPRLMKLWNAIPANN